MRKILFALSFVLLIASCKKTETAVVEPDWATNVQGIYTVSQKSVGYTTISGTHNIVVTITKTGKNKIKLIWTDNHSNYNGNPSESRVATFEVNNTTFVNETTVTFDDIALWEKKNSKFTGTCVFLGKNLQLTYKTVESPTGIYESSYLLIKQ